MLRLSAVLPVLLVTLLQLGVSMPQHRNENNSRVQQFPALPIAYIETSRDGVAMLPIAELLSVGPELRGMPSRGLHLVRRSQSIPLALADNNGILDDGDTLYFVGSHPSGDTTYFDAYSSVAAFEVWFDTTRNPLRMWRDTTTNLPTTVRTRLFVARHIEEEHEYVQGWLDNGRYSQTNTTFVTETVPGEGWAWAVTYSLRPFRTVLFTAPEPDHDDSIRVTLRYSSISDDAYTTPDNRLQLLYGGAVRDSATYDGVRDSTMSFWLRPDRDGCLVDSLIFRNTVATTAAQAVDYITTAGIERAVAYRDQIVGSCHSAQAERLNLENFRSSRMIMCDTVAMRWNILDRTEQGALFRLAARTQPARLSIGVGDTAFVVLRDPIAIAWIDVRGNVQLYTDRDASSAAAFIGALGVGTPFVIAIADGGVLDDRLRSRLESEGSTTIATVSAQQAYVAVGIRGDRTVYREESGLGAAALIAWLPTSRGAAYKTIVPLDSGDHALVITGVAAVEHARLRKATGAELFADTNRADYLVITHRNFRSAAERLASFRSARNGVFARVVDIADVFDAFGRGEKSPHALKSFLRYAYEQWRKPAPRAVLLVGDASWDPRKVSSDAINDDFIPSYGKPVSDFWYTLIEGDDFIPEMSIGRLPVKTPEQADAITDKLIENDTMPWQRWQKQFLLITGGADPSEQYDFYQSAIYTLVPLLVEPVQRALCADTTIVSLYAGTTSGLPLPTEIVERINAGTGWVNYIGHGAPRSLEVGGWEPERLNNKGRYPILASFSCQIGAFAEPTTQALGEDFLSAPSAGMAAVIATTGFGIRSYDDIVNAGLLATIARTPVRTVGDVLNRAKQFLFDGTQTAINTIMQTTLLGDPLMRVPIDSVPHPVLDQSSLHVSSIPPAQLLTSDADSVRIEATVFNAGLYADSAFDVRIVRTYRDRSDTASTTIEALCHSERVGIVFPIRDMPGEHRLRFEIDPEGKLGQSYPPLEIPLYVYADRLYPVQPQAGWNVSLHDTIVRFLNPTSARVPFRYQALLLSSNGDTLQSSDREPVVELATHCQWRLVSTLSPGKRYTILLRGYNTQRQVWTPWLLLPVFVTDTAETDRVEHAEGIGGDWSSATAIGFERRSTGELFLGTHIPVELMSAGGYQYLHGDTVSVAVQPGYRLRVNGTNVATERSDEVGVHLAVIPAADSVPRTVRWYTTWTTSAVGRSWGGAASLISFLRDSVRDDEYILLTSCGNAWALQFAQYADQFSRVLADFGAQRASQLSGSRSYIFVGMRSQSRPYVFEKINLDTLGGGGDTIAASVALPIFPLRAELDLPVAGPAERWENATVVSQCSDKRIHIAAYGSEAPDGQQTLIVERDADSISLVEIPAERFRYLRLHVTFERDSGDFSPCSISKALVRYVPLPEFVVRFDSLDAAPLRGDTLIASMRLVNLVTRCGIRRGVARFELKGSDGAPIPLATLPDSIAVFSSDTTVAMQIPTLSLPELCTLDVELKAPMDLYDFNDNAALSFAVRTDDVPPDIIGYASGSQLGDTTLVPLHTTLECALLDSSRIAITDSTALVLRLNGVRLPAGAMRYVFYPTPQATMLDRWRSRSLVRAAVEADVELERGTNVLIVTARDASGNTTTRQYVLLVPNYLSLDSSSVAPNPSVSGSEATFRIAYRGFDQTAAAMLELYDVLGRRVHSQPLQLRFGTNEIVLPLVDQSSGGALQSGAYYWRVWLESLGADEAIGGMLVVVR